MSVSIKSIFALFRSVVILTLIGLSLIAGDCDKTVQNNQEVPQQLVGSWILTEQTGSLQDICPDESARFQSDGIAELTCPGAASISRNFTIENNRLTYSQTSVRYDIEFSQDNNEVWFYGNNVSRNLKYLKVITSPGFTSKNRVSGFMNSSEKR